MLEAGWPELIEHRSRLGPVIALLGFADRATVGLARARARRFASIYRSMS